jgi:hypothetical protein
MTGARLVSVWQVTIAHNTNTYFSRLFIIRVCITLTLKSSLEVSEKNTRDDFLTKRPILHNFSYTFYIDCIYYEIDLRVTSFYNVI